MLASILEGNVLKSPSEQPTINVAEEEQQPVNSFTHVIEVAPSVASFGGWGPKIVGLGSLNRWN